MADAARKQRRGHLGSTTALLAVFAAAGCKSDDSASCTDCETNDWPRVIVAVAGMGVEAIELGASADDGTNLPVLRGGCPVLPSSLICSYTIGVSPSDEAMTLRATLPGGGTASAAVELRAYNYCARDIAYLRIDVDGDNPRILEPRYVSPCKLFDLEN